MVRYLARNPINSYRSAGIEVIFAFGGFEDVGAGFERAHPAGDNSLGDFTQVCFQLARIMQRFDGYGALGGAIA